MENEIDLKNKERINQSILRGIGALVVAFSHLRLNDASNIFMGYFSIGYLGVSLFYSFSGYNLFNSFINKNTWSNNFFIKKLVRIYVPFLVSNALFFMIYYFEGYEYSAKIIIEGIIGYKLLNSYLWYCVSILILYFVSYIVLSVTNFFRKDIRRFRIVTTINVFVIVCLYSVIYYLASMKTGWYTEEGNIFPMSFVIGSLWAIWGKDISEKIIKVESNILLVLIMLLALIHGGYVFSGGTMINEVNICKLIAPMILSCIIMISFRSMRLSGKALIILGDSSYYIYLYHAHFLNLFRNNKVYINNDTLYTLLYLISIVVFSIGMNKIHSLVFDKLIKRLQKK